MRFKKTRTAWSVCCGVLCLLLVGLWARSYFSFDRVSGLVVDDHCVIMVSHSGHVSAVTTTGPVIVTWNIPKWDSGPILPYNVTEDDWMRMIHAHDPAWQDADMVWPKRTILGFGWMTRGLYTNLPKGETGWHSQGLTWRSLASIGVSGLIVPHWFGVLALAFMASLPWMP